MLSTVIILAAVESRSPAPLSRSQRARLAELFRRHGDLVWRLLRRQGLGAAQADDALQQVFLVALDKLESLEPGKERSYLCATAIHVSRRAPKWQEISSPTLPDADSLIRLDEQLDSERKKRLLAEVLQSLDEDLRLVIVLQDIEGLSKREAADILGIPEGTVASRTRRGRELFSAELRRRVRGAHEL